ETFSKKVLLMAIFLFLILLCIDIVKDTLTKSVDKAFGYTTIPNYFNAKTTNGIIVSLMFITMAVSLKLILRTGISGFMAYYFVTGLLVFILCIYLIISNSRRNKFFTINILRLWVFLGIISMLLSGLEGKL
ncbi:MAG: prenyltransferase, partial [Chryseobacterium taeanense]